MRSEGTFCGAERSSFENNQIIFHRVALGFANLNSPSLQKIKLQLNSQFVNLLRKPSALRILAASISGVSVLALGLVLQTLDRPSVQGKYRTQATRRTIQRYNFERQPVETTNSFDIQHLVMQGGDPHIRALMRAISASEAYDEQPYNIIYGGQKVFDLSSHPEICVTIGVGPNTGNCSTAAGRYQFINTTWYTLAEQYHPQAQRFLDWEFYSFEPHYQDVVLYRWLSDETAWGVDLAQYLREGRVQEVLRMLSPTWTSLGYGIETNSMSQHLPSIYNELLQEEVHLTQAQI
jgi:muramidase (phage lysozyme)